MNTDFSYLQTLSGYSVDENVSIADVIHAIDIIAMDDEHGAFWVGMGGEEEYVLEAQKNLNVIAIFEGSECRKQFDNWDEIKILYQHFLHRDIAKVKSLLSI